MNRDTKSAATTSSRPVCKLHLSNRAEQRNNSPFVQIRDHIVQHGLPVFSTNINCTEIVNIDETNSKHGKNQENHNLILQDPSLFPGVQQGTGVSQATSGWRLHPQELSTTLDIQDQKRKTRGGLIVHSNHCRQRVQCSSSSISGNLQREANDPEEPLDILHVSSCNGINTFELVSNNILSRPCLLESDKTAKTVVSKHRLCDVVTEILSPVCYLTSAESRTKHFDLTADLQYNSSLSNLGISSSSKICSDSGDNSSDETAKYRTDLREQCKRHHNSELYTVVKDNASIKNTFVLQDIDYLGFPSYVLTPQGTHSGVNKHSGDSHGRTRKNRHRRKHEIGKNPVSGNKATLQVHSSETDDTPRAGPQDKDFLKLLNCKLYLPPPTGSVHKESPRARFERDRAARNNAISSKSDSTPSNLAAFCIKEPTIIVKEPETVKNTSTEKSAVVDIDSVLLKSTQLKRLTPIQQSWFENTSPVVNEYTDDSGSQEGAVSHFSSVTNNNALVKTSPELRQTTPNSGTKVQRFLQSTLANNAGFLDPNKKTVLDIALPEKLTNCSVLRTNGVYVSTLTAEEDSRAPTSIVDKIPAQVGARVNTHLPFGTSVTSYASFWDNSQCVNNNNCFRNTSSGEEVVNRNTESRVNFSSVFYSKENKKREDIITSNNSCTRQLGPGTLPTNLTDLCLDVKPADSLSSAHFECAIPPGVGHTYRYQNINTSERSNNLPDFRHRSRSEFVRDFNRALGFGSVSDTGVCRQESARDSSDSVIENRLNANTKSHHQPRSLASNVCIKHRLPQSEIDEQLKQVSQFVNDLFCEGVKDNPQARNYKYTANQLQCTQCLTEINKLSATEEATPKCYSASQDNSFCEVSRAGNNTNATHDPVSSRDCHQIEHLTENNPSAISISNCSPCAQMNTSGKRMLASRGLRIYDYAGDVNTVLNPDKPIDLKSACASSFQWEGATYLILPTVLDSLTAISAANTSNGATIGNTELLIHRSVSDSGVTTHSSVTSDRSNNFLANDNNRDVEDNFASASSRNKKLSFKQRSLSADVLCAGDDSKVGFISMPAESHNTSEDNINAGRGYVEWRTCSTWLQKPDLEINLEKDSRGYVEWDNIWAATQPRMGAGKDDEHLYDSVGNYNSYSSNQNIAHRPCEVLHSLPVTTETPSRKEFLSVSVTTETPSREELHSLAVTTETPPALPERTYISRLKKCSSAELSSSCLESPKSNHHHRHHHRHHDISNLRKYHNHCHHNHNSNNKQKQHASATSSTVSAPLTRSSKYSTSVVSKQCKHISGSSENGLRPHSSSSDSNDLQNYATVHKLRGYRFNNNATASECPVPNFPKKPPISSENYCHLAPLASKENMGSLQTSDILDYIDGLHDSMSPKRRENIYILLNNKQTRAKFSESLEIESRLLSRGLISGSSGSEALEGTLRERRTVCSETTQGVFNFEMPKRKGAIAPVSSTYV